MVSVTKVALSLLSVAWCALAQDELHEPHQVIESEWHTGVVLILVVATTVGLQISYHYLKQGVVWVFDYIKDLYKKEQEKRKLEV